MTSTDAHSATATRAGAGWLLLTACCLGTFLLLLYTSIVTVALPSIGTGLDAAFGSRQWVIDIYTLALAGLLLGAGAVGDAVGSRRLYLVGLSGFTLATLGCGLAPSAAALVAMRAAQGVAGAAMFAAILPLIGLTYTEAKQRATAFAVWGAVAGAASAVGTVCGGVITEYASWRWLFLGAVPVCVLTLYLASRTLPVVIEPGAESASAGRRITDIDWPGIALITLAVTAFAYAVITGGESGWDTAGSTVGWMLAATAGCAFIRVERFATEPILPLGLFRTARFVAVLLVAFGYYFAAFGALPAIAAWLQTDVGLGSLATSFVLVVQLLVFIAVSGLLGRQLHRRHPAWMLGGGTILVGIGALAGLAVTAGNGWGALLPFLVLSGAGAGIVSPALPAAAIASTADRYAGAASSAANAARQLGLALGIAVCGTITRTATTDSISMALTACGALALGAGVAAVHLLRREPD
ncbi:MFS transporter [Jongsikchunia kroppenstedtii]|uniref:MFS transporter n=1 Tax=Jongsikchunia kroppenstedtii TaxID=1121721 RepID=UPI0003820C4C|nr:MFS transporter [Jongsikchunia kroppenstedtii]